VVILIVAILMSVRWLVHCGCDWCFPGNYWCWKPFHTLIVSSLEDAYSFPIFKFFCYGCAQFIVTFKLDQCKLNPCFSIYEPSDQAQLCRPPRAMASVAITWAQ
jgi:hypothetical protein